MDNYKIQELKMSNQDFINYCYLIIDKKTKEAAVTDPAWNMEKIETALKENNAVLKKIFITHAHIDHINLVWEIQKIYKDVEVCIGTEEAAFYGFSAENLKLLNDGDTINLGEIKIKCILTPGHTYGGMCYTIGNEYLFSGDTLFIEACGRCDLKGGSAEKMFESLQKIKNTLDPEIKVYPGHCYGMEKGKHLKELEECNVYYKINDRQKFIEARNRSITKGLSFK